MNEKNTIKYSIASQNIAAIEKVITQLEESLNGIIDKTKKESQAYHTDNGAFVALRRKKCANKSCERCKYFNGHEAWFRYILRIQGKGNNKDTIRSIYMGRNLTKRTLKKFAWSIKGYDSFYKEIEGERKEIAKNLKILRTVLRTFERESSRAIKCAEKLLQSREWENDDNFTIFTG